MLTIIIFYISLAAEVKTIKVTIVYKSNLTQFLLNYISRKLHSSSRTK